MAEEATQAQAAPPKSKKGLILIIVGAVVLLGVLGLGAYFIFGGEEEHPPTAEAQEGGHGEGGHGEGGHGGDDGEGPTARGPLVPLGPIVTNLNTPTGARYMKVNIDLECDGEQHREAVTLAISPIRSAILIYINNVQVDQTQGAENTVRIRDELKTLINDVIGAPLVKEIYFVDFVVQ